MLSEIDVQSLKQKDVSENGELTKERTQSAWKSASAKTKNEILEHSGLSRGTVYRVFKTGSISAKLTVTMAQVLNISPQYFTGETDEPGECNANNLAKFLRKNGYGDLLKKQMQQSRKKTQFKENPEPEPITSAHDADTEPVLELRLEDCVFPQLTDEEWITVFRAMLLRAKGGGKNQKLADKVKALLFT